VGKGKVKTIYIMYSNRIKHIVQYQVHAIIFKRAVLCYHTKPIKMLKWGRYSTNKRNVPLNLQLTAYSDSYSI